VRPGMQIAFENLFTISCYFLRQSAKADDRW